MTQLRDTIEEAVAFLRQRTEFRPEFGIILGTGLGGFAEEIEAEVSIPFDEIPGFVKSTATSHAGNLVLGDESMERWFSERPRSVTREASPTP